VVSEVGLAESNAKKIGGEKIVTKITQPHFEDLDPDQLHFSK
jgi:hypothetical protein